MSFEKVNTIKSSLYNLFVPTKDPEKYILYNTLHDSILVVDGELKEMLENKPLDALTEEHMHVLSDMGIIVDDDLDERKVLSFRYHREKFSSPYSTFVIFPTLACNLACKYCYERSSALPPKTMDEETVDETISFIKQMSLEDKTQIILIKLYGGEPLLNVEACSKIVREVSAWAQQNSFKVAVVLQTNGTLLSEEILRALAPHLAYVEITLDGPQKNHDKVRIYKDGTGTYEDILHAVDIASAVGVPVVLRINVEHAQDLREVLSALTGRGLRGREGVAFYYAQTSEFGLCELFGNNNLCQEDEGRALEMAPELGQVIEELGWTPQLETPDFIQKQKFVACNNEKKGRYVIDPFGDVYLCFFRAGQKEYRAGTLKGDAGQFGPMYYEMLARSPLQFEECQTCVYLPFCGGGCAMRAYEQSGTFHTNNCGSIKEFSAKRILLYLKRKYPERFGVIQ